jgi:hypothetical protein|tara:strand:+ start:171 stop:353 length:183 start_codon:yes stop_codon:yes gene_type:complete
MTEYERLIQRAKDGYVIANKTKYIKGTISKFWYELDKNDDKTLWNAGRYIWELPQDAQIG